MSSSFRFSHVLVAISRSFPFPRFIIAMSRSFPFPRLLNAISRSFPFPRLLNAISKSQVNHHPTDQPLLCSRTNLAATLANAQINPTSKYGKVFPHMCDDGRYPSDFNTPKTVETMKVLDSKSFF